MKNLTCILGCALLLSACDQGPPATQTGLGSAHSENWEAMLNAGDIDGLVAVYTEDTRVMPPNGSIKIGRTAVREEFGAMIAAGMQIDLQSIDSKAAGDVAYNVGTYALSINGETIDKGKWIETWDRGADGTWRISSDIWNSDNPAPEQSKPAMTHIMGMHKVGDPEIWLAAWRGEDGRRKDFAANGAPHVHVMQSPDDPNLTGLVIGLSDPGAFEAWLNSDEGKAAAEEDTVDMESMTLLMEVN